MKKFTILQAAALAATNAENISKQMFGMLYDPFSMLSCLNDWASLGFPTNVRAILFPTVHDLTQCQTMNRERPIITTKPKPFVKFCLAKVRMDSPLQLSWGTEFDVPYRVSAAVGLCMPLDCQGSDLEAMMSSVCAVPSCKLLEQNPLLEQICAALQPVFCDPIHRSELGRDIHLQCTEDGKHSELKRRPRSKEDRTSHRPENVIDWIAETASTVSRDLQMEDSPLIGALVRRIFTRAGSLMPNAFEEVIHVLERFRFTPSAESQVTEYFTQEEMASLLACGSSSLSRPELMLSSGAYQNLGQFSQCIKIADGKSLIPLSNESKSINSLELQKKGSSRYCVVRMYSLMASGRCVDSTCTQSRFEALTRFICRRTGGGVTQANGLTRETCLDFINVIPLDLCLSVNAWGCENSLERKVHYYDTVNFLQKALYRNVERQSQPEISDVRGDLRQLRDLMGDSSHILSSQLKTYDQWSVADNVGSRNLELMDQIPLTKQSDVHQCTVHCHEKLGLWSIERIIVSVMLITVFAIAPFLGFSTATDEASCKQGILLVTAEALNKEKGISQSSLDSYIACDTLPELVGHASDDLVPKHHNRHYKFAARLPKHLVVQILDCFHFADNLRSLGTRVEAMRVSEIAPLSGLVTVSLLWIIVTNTFGGYLMGATSRNVSYGLALLNSIDLRAVGSSFLAMDALVLCLGTYMGFVYLPIMRDIFRTDSGRPIYRWLAIKKSVMKFAFSKILHMSISYWFIALVFLFGIPVFWPGPNSTALMNRVWHGEAGMEGCSKWMWSNFFMINNLIPRQQLIGSQCLLWTSPVATGVQFFCLALIMLPWAIYHMPSFIMVSLTVAAGALVKTFLWAQDLTMSNLQLATFAMGRVVLVDSQNILRSPIVMLPVFLCGFWIGLLIKKLSPRQVYHAEDGSILLDSSLLKLAQPTRVSRVFSGVSMSIAMFGAIFSLALCVVGRERSGGYSVLTRLSWVLSLAWIIVICGATTVTLNGRSGVTRSVDDAVSQKIRKFLTLRPFLYYSSAALNIFLIQAPLIELVTASSDIAVSLNRATGYFASACFGAFSMMLGILLEVFLSLAAAKVINICLSDAGRQLFDS